MTPDIDMRLGTIVRALEQVVIPGLPADQVLAIEQATLCVGHLGIIIEQLRYTGEYDAACLADMTALAEQLITASAGGPGTRTATEALRDLLSNAGVASDGTVATAKKQRNGLAAAIDELIQASGLDAEPDFVAALHRLVLEHGARQAFRDRAWFRATGLDPDRATLPSIPELLRGG